MAESRASFTIEGVASEEDVGTIEDGLRELDGVMGVEVDRESGDVSVRYDEEFLSEEEVRTTVQDAGFDVEEDVE